MIKRDYEGLYFESESGIRYELLEGMNIGGRGETLYTSDLIFVFLANADYNVDNNVVGYLFGVEEMERNPESYTDTLNEMVKAFEKRNRMNDLSKILEEIDKIEDDAEFCEAEHDAVRDYCQSREFKLTDEEISEIESRGLYDSFLYWKDTYSEGMED